MISHSMVQSGPGFPYFAPAVYSYIATGNLEEAVAKVSVVDIADLDPVEFVAKVMCKTGTNFHLFFFNILHVTKKTLENNHNYFRLETFHLQCWMKSLQL